MATPRKSDIAAVVLAVAVVGGLALLESRRPVVGWFAIVVTTMGAMGAFAQGLSTDAEHIEAIDGAAGEYGPQDDTLREHPTRVAGTAFTRFAGLVALLCLLYLVALELGIFW